MNYNDLTEDELLAQEEDLSRRVSTGPIDTMPAKKDRISPKFDGIIYSFCTITKHFSGCLSHLMLQYIIMQKSKGLLSP